MSGKHGKGQHKGQGGHQAQDRSATPVFGEQSEYQPQGRNGPVAKTAGQQELIDTIKNHLITMAIGPAGTGKTYLAIAMAAHALQTGKVDRIILTRAAVEAGEKIGFLPGEMEEKMAPYMRPLYDELAKILGTKRMRDYIAEGIIEIAPVGFMRGRTLTRAFIVADEAQNMTYAQLKMVLSRFGEGSKMVVTGDPAQSDLPFGESGLAYVAECLETLEGIGITQLTDVDIVRHPLVAAMLAVLPDTMPKPALPAPRP